MSDTATPTLVETPKGPAKSTAKKKVFDLEKFEKVSKEVEYLEPEPLTSLDQVLQLDEAKALEYVNLGLSRDAWKTARKSIEGVSPKIINQFCNVFRQLPPYSEETDRKKQTAAIYVFIKSQEQILNSLKLAAAAAPADDDNDDDDGEGDE